MSREDSIGTKAHVLHAAYLSSVPGTTWLLGYCELQPKKLLSTIGCGHGNPWTQLNTTWVTLEILGTAELKQPNLSKWSH